jgi:hypothetical protein
LSLKESEGIAADHVGTHAKKLAPLGRKKLQEMRDLGILFERLKEKHPEAVKPPVKSFKLAPLSPLVLDPIWLHDFRQLFQRFFVAARDVARQHKLPGYPIYICAERLLRTCRWLDDHLGKVKADMQDRAARDDRPAIGFGPLIEDGWIAYQWAYMLIRNSRYLGPPLSLLNDETFGEPLAWVPTEDELAAFSAIIDLLSRLDLETYSRTVADPELDREDSPQRNSDPADTRFRISLDGNRLQLNTLIYFLDDDVASFMRELIEAGAGHWVAGSDMGEMVKPRPDRVFRKLKDESAEIAALIESKTGKGYRLTQDVITPTNAKKRP